MRYKFFVTCSIVFFSLLYTTGCFTGYDEWKSYSVHLRQAEEFERQQDYEAAIEAYRKHVALRLESENREGWENPYFYHLLIGDLYLEHGEVEKALDEYKFAQSKEVSEGLVSDRFRLVANWLAERNRYEEAIEILNEYRSSDPLLYDLMTDRLARLLVERDEAVMRCKRDGDCLPEKSETP